MLIRFCFLLFFVLFTGIINTPFPFLAAPGCLQADELDLDDDDFLDDEPEVCETCDPLEPVNRFFFHFNDKLYFWALKPVAKGYGATVPEVIRDSIKRAFKNLLMPVRLVNNLLQGNFKGSGIELSRFLINSTVGVLGMADPAREKFDLQAHDEDLGQTLGTYGIGNGIYICWPFFGPSTLRDTVGLLGDSFYNPMSYLYMTDAPAGVATYAGRQVNNTSLAIGDYESFVESAFDPYVALRDAYIQYRRNKIENSDNQHDSPIAAFSNKDEKKVSENSRKKQFNEQKFSIQVGSYLDSVEAEELVQRLQGKYKDVTMVEFNRGDYSFYGVQIPVKGDFVTAKLVENDMSGSDFPEAFVVTR
jgi:phospholipid-binding lipoprotein MlaA